MGRSMFLGTIIILAIGMLAILFISTKEPLPVRAADATYPASRTLEVGRYTEAEGRILYLDKGFVTLAQDNVFSRSEPLTIKQINVLFVPRIMLCSPDFCSEVARTDIQF